MGRVVGYLAMSLDGFIAGPNDELSWLERPRESGLPLAVEAWAATRPDGLEFDDFLSTIGCIVMGRRTYDVVAGFDGPWPYGDTPLLVVTSRPLETAHASVEASGGDVAEVIDRAKALAGDRDVYVDGGATIRSVLSEKLLDHLVLTIQPTALGAGIPLFAGLAVPAEFAVEKVERWGPGFVQLHLTARAA
ncbi:dihydrofolate reductase family protein [Demequina sp.]|uniref:dihydrofolate reductase family protein n=1 Tax=Demequina sp. TaxID=2050685 RepID=UPI003D1383AC